MLFKTVETQPRASIGLKAATIGALLFLNVPILLIFLYAFTTEDAAFTFPPPGLTTKWFGILFARQDFWNALGLSLGVAIIATTLSLTVGTLTALAIYRSRFFGKDAISLMMILPLGCCSRSTSTWSSA